MILQNQRNLINQFNLSNWNNLTNRQFGNYLDQSILFYSNDEIKYLGFHLDESCDRLISVCNLSHRKVSM